MPPPGIPGRPVFGLSATMASVVISSPAIDAAFCSADRTTLVGSMMPLVTRLMYSPFWASKPYEYWSFSRILPTMSDPSSPALMAIWRAGQESALRTISTPVFWSSFCVRTLQYFAGAQERDAAAWQDAFLDCSAGGVHRVVDAILAPLHLDLGGPADADHCNTAGELRQPLLKLLLVLGGRGLLD